MENYKSDQTQSISTRDRLIDIFNDTMRLSNENQILFNSIQYSRKNQKIYWEEDAIQIEDAIIYEEPKILLSNKRTLEAASQYKGKRVCILNFASCINPGGAVQKGTKTQEESLCRISTLYSALTDQDTAAPFYSHHRELIKSGKMGWENRDDCIFTPDVMVFKADDYECHLLAEEEWYKVDVITCAAPDLRHLREEDLAVFSKKKLADAFEKRIKRILEIAILHQTEVIILGAFGCGAFQNPVTVVSYAFNNVLKEYRKYFETIEFAVYGKKYSHDYLKIAPFGKIDGIIKLYK